ncbi:MAG: hypothetical protein R3D55_07840 [Chloroflexota bacterium]
MKQMIWSWLMAGILLAGLVAACSGVEATDTAVCDFTNQTAVTLNLRDENGDPQRLVRVSYSLNGGPWQDLPEVVNETAVLRDGPGTYQIQVEKPGYAPNEITVVVPEPAAGSCELVAETAVLPMSRAVCPDMNLANLEVEIVAEGENVTVTAVAQPGGVQTLTCTAGTATNCSLALPGTGQLLLTAEDLGGIGPMQINDGIVGYALRDSQLTLRQNNVDRTVTLSGAESLSAVLDVALDEVGCPLADFRTLEVQAVPDVASGEPFPRLSVEQQNDLMITDLGNEACFSDPIPYPVWYEAILPAGTPVADVGVFTWQNERWQAADCALTDGRFLCEATLPNPFVGQPYIYKVVVGDQEEVGTSLPFDQLCLVFD